MPTRGISAEGALAVLKAVVDRVVAGSGMSAGPLPKRPKDPLPRVALHGRSRQASAQEFAELRRGLMSSACPIPGPKKLSELISNPFPQKAETYEIAVPPPSRVVSPR